VLTHLDAVNQSVGAKPWRSASAQRGEKVAIVTVCLNDLRGLQATYESVRMQTLRPRQWIVADGASLDGTPDWLGQLDFPPLDWTSKADGGIYRGMNRGLERAEADYVLFLNSGDTLAAPDVLEAVDRELTHLANPPAVLFGDSFEVDRWSVPHLRRARPVWWIWLAMPTTHQAMFFRRDVLPAGFDTRYRLSADYAAITELFMARRGADFHHLPRPLCNFHLGGRSDQWRTSFLRENLEIRRRVLGMPAVPAYLLHLAHYVHGWIKQHLPSLHGLVRYG
jgi:putative colanic acid biosynthesis glycosyltransferase